MAIGKVRAWLKYLLDKLFDHEGSSVSSPVRNRSSWDKSSAALANTGDPGRG
jgi:hypothetical protein